MTRTTAATDRSPTATTERSASRGAALGYGMNGFDTMLVALSIPAIAAGVGVSITAASALTSITLAAAVAGAPLMGMLTDRIGRVRGLVAAVALYGVGSGLTGLADSYPAMVGARLIVGVGIGATFGAAMALAAENRPSGTRARATAGIALAWQAGVLVAVLAAEPVLDHLGWRAWFLLGAIPAVVILPMLRVHEPAPGPQPAERGRLRALVAGRDARRVTGGLTVASVVQNFGYYGVALWLPFHRSEEIGVSGASATVLATLVAAGTGIGSVVSGALGDRIGRRAALRLFQAAAAAAVPAFLLLDGLPAILAGAVVLGIVADGALGTFGVLIAELHPRSCRVTALNTLFNLGRGVGGFGPVVLAALATGVGTVTTVVLLAGSYLLAAAATSLVPEPGADSDDRRGAAIGESRAPVAHRHIDDRT